MKKLLLMILCSASLVLTVPLPAPAQGWSNSHISEMLVTELSPTGAMEQGKWFTSAQQLTRGVRGLGIIYAHVLGSAGTVSIHAASFYWTGNGWRKYRDISNLFGMSPQNAVFSGDRATLTTVTLGPNDPRCCPTVETLWSIDLQSGTAVRLN